MTRKSNENSEKNAARTVMRRNMVTKWE